MQRTLANMLAGDRAALRLHTAHPQYPEPHLAQQTTLSTTMHVSYGTCVRVNSQQPPKDSPGHTTGSALHAGAPQFELWHATSSPRSVSRFLRKSG